MRKVRSAAAAGLVLAAPLVAAALASATLASGASTVAHQPHSTSVSVLNTTAGLAASEPKLPVAAGD
jgi:hypothetical protein